MDYCFICIISIIFMLINYINYFQLYHSNCNIDIIDIIDIIALPFRISCSTVLSTAFVDFHYISRDHPNAHELTNYILHPSPEPARRSPGRPGAPGKRLRRRYGMVPVSPTGTTCSFPRIHSMGMTKIIGFLWSSSYRTREPGTDRFQPT